MNAIDAYEFGVANPLTDEAFLALGIQHLAYMRSTNLNGRKMWSVHAADGSPLTVLDAEDIYSVQATIRQNDLIPVSVH